MTVPLPELLAAIRADLESLGSVATGLAAKIAAYGHRVAAGATGDVHGPADAPVAVTVRQPAYDPEPKPGDTDGRMWTPERDALVRRLYPAGVAAREIARQINATPGRFVPHDRVAIRASKLGISRPARDARPEPDPKEESPGADRDAGRITTHLPASALPLGSPAPRPATVLPASATSGVVDLTPLRSMPGATVAVPLPAKPAAAPAAPPGPAPAPQPKSRAEAMAAVSKAIAAKPKPGGFSMLGGTVAKPAKAPDREAIDRFIAEKGVTKLPAAAVDVTTATIPPEDKAQIAAHQAELDRAWKERGNTPWRRTKRP